MLEKQIDKTCSICEKSIQEYDKTWKCKKNHNWRSMWRRDKTSKKYEKFLEKRKASMKKNWRKRLNELNKKTPIVYASRKNNLIK